MGKANRERVKQANQVPLTGSWIHAVRVLLFSAAIITVYLALSTEVKNGEAPGCGPDSECDKVLTSPWAYSLGIPISLLGLGLYGAFLGGQGVNSISSCSSFCPKLIFTPLAFG